MPSCSRGRRATLLQALTTTLNVLPCLIRGYKHSLGGVPRTFRTKSAAIRHLTGEGHANSISLVDQSLCREVGISTHAHTLIAHAYPKYSSKQRPSLIVTMRSSIWFHPFPPTVQCLRPSHHTTLPTPTRILQCHPLSYFGY